MTLSSLYAGMTMDTPGSSAASCEASSEDLSGDITTNLAPLRCRSPGRRVKVGETTGGTPHWRDPSVVVPYDDGQAYFSAALCGTVVHAGSDVLHGSLGVRGNLGCLVLGVLDCIRGLLSGVVGGVSSSVRRVDGLLADGGRGASVLGGCRSDVIDGGGGNGRRRYRGRRLPGILHRLGGLPGGHTGGNRGGDHAEDQQSAVLGLLRLGHFPGDNAGWLRLLQP